jgi:type III secretion protein V
MILFARLRLSEVVLLGFVVAIAAMLIVPLPTPLLDLLLVINISFSILLLLVGLYVANSAALYTFPTVLLLSTLFRLGLNVASSRLILSQGDAGRVIEAFGTFLIRGEIVVGIIIFSIVTVVNFIVIAKGATRVSEVAARFFLDSLPGRQSVIDNDARAGVISAEDARKKRDSLRLESQLYGSMDGAMKFVQGDAVAGFFIIVVNIVGGVYMGVASGLGVQDAVQTYTVLTVGDGLVTQIPSLLTSICAGIIVTRVSSSDTASLGMDLKTQLFSQPTTLLVTSCILLVFAMLPGVPALPFILVAIVAAATGAWLVKKDRDMPSRSQASGDFRRGVGVSAGGQGERELDVDEGALSIELDREVLFRSYRGNAPRHLLAWSSFKEAVFADVGLALPEINVKASDLLAPASFRVARGGVEMLSGTVVPDGLFMEVSHSQAAILGLSIVREEEHPISGHKVFWTGGSQRNRSILEAASLKSRDFFDYIALRIASFCLGHPEEFLSVTEVHSMLRAVEKRHPGLIEEGFGKDFLPIPKLTELLHELVRQGVSVRDFRGIIEGVSSYCATQGVSLGSESAVEIPEVVHHLRSSRRRQVLRRFIGSGRSLHVVSMSPEVEQLLADADFGGKLLPLALEDGDLSALHNGLSAVLRPSLEGGVLPVALLCPQELKEKVLSFVRMYTHPLFVTTFEELDPSVPVQQIGVWGVTAR